MANEKKCVKFERSSVEQLKLFVNFSRQHPEFQASKNDPRGPRRMHQLWNEVAQQLNSFKWSNTDGSEMGRDVRKLENQLRTRARRIKMDQRLTSGGPSTSRTLSEFEELAVDTFGAAAVDGVERINAVPVS